MNWAVELKNVNKDYKVGSKTQNVLSDVNLKIGSGRLIVVLGPSGAGKSTLLNLIAGMDTVTSGKIIVDGENISKYTQNQLTDFRARNIGFIFQFYNILPTLTVAENIELVNGIKAKASKTTVKQVLKEVGLRYHGHKFPSQLSGGEQQRVSIARAIFKESKLLLCDEPTGALDSKTGVTILKLLKQQTETGGTVIIVTHNSLIAEIADEVVRIKNGQIESHKINHHPKNINQVEW